MPRPQKHKCTSHSIKLCPEVKEIVLNKKKEMEANKTRVGGFNFDEIVTAIIVEWMDSKRG